MDPGHGGVTAGRVGEPCWQTITPSDIIIWFFVFGFAKSVRADISSRELEALQKLADDLLGLSDPELDSALSKATLEEICHD